MNDMNQPDRHGALPKHLALTGHPDEWVVDRVSVWNSDDPDESPCDGAYRASYRSRRYTTNGFAWQDAWAVIIPDLMAFVRKHGECIIREEKDEGVKRLTIHDDYIY